jgi:hypothetical protein
MQVAPAGELVVQMTRSANSPDKRLDLQLLCGSVVVGDLLNVTVHQGTWFAQKLRPAINAKMGKKQRRICEYIAFSREWHDRLLKDEDPDASEYDRFKDLRKRGLWCMRTKSGEDTPVDMPVFVEGDEVSWGVPECGRKPSPEVASWKLWSRLTKGG